MPIDELISLNEARRRIKKRLRLTKSPDLATVWRWRKRGLLEARRVGGRIFFEVEELERFLSGTCEQRTTEAPAEPPKRKLSPARQKRERRREHRLARAGL